MWYSVVSSMFRRSYLLTLACLLPLAAACNNECLQSSDIQVNVLPDPTIDPRRIAKLHVALSVNGSQAKSLVIMPTAPIESTGSAFILRPDATPAKPTYNITVTIEAMDGSNMLIAIGSDSEQVAAKGCNRLNAHLAAIPPPPVFDMSLPTASDGFMPKIVDLAGVVTPPTDLAGCVGGMPDEDNDGRANSCDLCPADYDPTPTDSDGDGLPDACDPDPTRATNKNVYFDPFDSDSKHWMGNYTVPTGMSFLQIDSNNVAQLNMPISVANLVDKVPLNVRVQTFVLAPGYYSSSTGPALAFATVFLGDGSDPFAPGTNGVLCQIRFDQSNGDAIRIRPVVGGSLGVGNSTPTGSCASTTLPPPPQFCFGTDTLYRLRLTQRGDVYSCDVIDTNGNAYAPANLSAAAPSGPTQFMVLQEENLRAQFHSVVAETALLP
jgi:hypothetical protein